MYKIAVIGDAQSILSFGFIGVEIFEADGVEKTVSLIDKLAAENYAVIYITEKLFSMAETAVEKYRNAKMPVIVPISGIVGNTGVGNFRLHEEVKRAVGSDIL